MTQQPVGERGWSVIEGQRYAGPGQCALMEPSNSFPQRQNLASVAGQNLEAPPQRLRWQVESWPPQVLICKGNPVVTENAQSALAPVAFQHGLLHSKLASAPQNVQL